MVAMLLFTAFNSVLYYNEVTHKSLISDVSAAESFIRVGSKELYQLKLHNSGEIEYGLEIKIKFDIGTQITNMQYEEPEGTEGYASINVENNEYTVRFEKIYAGEDIEIRFDIVNELFERNESILIGAKSIEAYTNDGKIIIYPFFGE